MIHRLTVAATLALLALPAAVAHAAETAGLAMNGAEFDAYTSGKTLTYGAGGDPYGVEQYLPGRRVVWQFLGDECLSGTWVEQDRLICFTYEVAPGGTLENPQCWSFYAEPGGLRARFQGSGGSTDLIEVQDSPAPLSCPGPDLGV